LRGIREARIGQPNARRSTLVEHGRTERRLEIAALHPRRITATGGFMIFLSF